MTKECINCGYKWKFSIWEKIKIKLLLRLTNEARITYICPSCGEKTELIRRHVILEGFRDA